MTRVPTRTLIEQAIAYGRPLDWIVEHLGVSTQDVAETLRYLDRVNGDDNPDDDPSPQASTHESPPETGRPQMRPQASLERRPLVGEASGMELLAEAARMESARVYGRLCPEHRSRADAGELVDLQAARRRKRGVA